MGRNRAGHIITNVMPKLKIEEIMKITKIQMCTYYFIRYTLLIAYPAIIIATITYWVLGASFPDSILDYIVIVIGFPFVIVNMILPGIIYEGKYKATWHGFTLNQFKYNLFFGLTLGLGPTYIFFKKYDPILRTYLKNKKEMEA